MPANVNAVFDDLAPEQVYLCAARVGGIGANSRRPVDFLLDNMRISSNIIEAAHAHGVKKLVNLGSSCIYPREAPQPMPESCLMTGALEPTNEGYAIAKIAALKLVQAYRRERGAKFVSVMPTNLYGPGDHYDLEGSHVLPTLIMKFEEARVQGHAEVVLWGTGKPLREFLFVEDLADALLLVMDQYDDDEWINIGSDDEVSIADLALLVAERVKYRGKIVWDPTRPDGTMRKKLDCSKIRALGWKPQVSLTEGIDRTIDDYRMTSSLGR